MAYLVKQISNIVNDAVKDALGKNAAITQLPVILYHLVRQFQIMKRMKVFINPL